MQTAVDNLSWISIEDTYHTRSKHFPTQTEMELGLLNRLRNLMFPPHDVGNPDEDVKRWHRQGFRFASHQSERGTSLSYALVQGQGGPCGVLASVQAYVLSHVLWRDNDNDAGDETTDHHVLVTALLEIVEKATESGNRLKLLSLKDPAQSFDFGDDGSKLEMKDFAKEEMDVAKEYWESKSQSLQSDAGVILFVFSVILSRTPETCRGDMDDETSTLTGQFGYCNQEMVNLMLTGRCYSQIHDGNVWVGNTGFQLRGLTERPKIGYLTHLEALRYCTVGSYYKNPLLPIWVIGSESHYTVLFSKDKTITEQSESEIRKAEARRAFDAKDDQDNGFITVDKLGQVLESLHLNEIAGNETKVKQLIEEMEMQGAGLILWNSFWKSVKPLLLERDGISSTSTASNQQQHLNQPSGNAAMVLEPWACPQCTFINENGSSTCEMCMFEYSPALSSTPSKKQRKQDDDEDDFEINTGKTYEMYHLNGLLKKVHGEVQGPILVPFKLTTVDKDLAGPGTHGYGNNALEEVLQTRWQGCIIEWDKQKYATPSITG